MKLKNNAVRLFYEYANNKTKDLVKQIKSKTINNGKFKNLNIGDDKTAVIESLKNLQAFYISTPNNSEDGIIDLRSKDSTDYLNRLLSSNSWNVTYDDAGKMFWFFTVKF